MGCVITSRLGLTAETRLSLTADCYPMTTDSMEKMFQRTKARVKMDKLHPNLCRHTFAVRYLINGGDIFTLQKILGHESLEMTRKYVYLASGDVKEKHRRFRPMDNLDFRQERRGRRPGSR
ncbi:MAG: hypothetical protein EHM70_13590 [Chloroflexota bacterium]|nr:MAG: hypothetical protein EHM70_13590 [Chloroflexota bacterium]